MKPERAAFDASGLPSVTFGPKGPLWWGTVGFIVIEGYTIVLTIAAFFYLRLNETRWPPSPYAPPDVLIPGITAVLLLLLIIPMIGVKKAAHRFDRMGVAKGMLITAVMTVPVVVLHWFNLQALNVAYDTHAYGSAVWGVVVLHVVLVAFDLVETLVMGVMFLIGHAKKKHFSDASEAALYQFFLSLSWLPIYLIIYWGPRVL